MPAFNEEDHIEAGISETVRTFDEFKSDYEIIVIDDGSRDKTFELAKRCVQQFDNGRIIVRKNRRNFGKGRALRKGFRYAKGDFVIFLDSDMDLHPGQIDTFFDIMELTGSDIVIGSKRHPNSQLFYPWQRRVMSSVYFFLVKIMFGLPINDTQTGLKLFKHGVLKKVFKEFISREFAFDLELLVQAHSYGYRIAEAPVCIHSQRLNNRIGPATVYKMCVDTFWIYLRYVRTRARRLSTKINGKRKIGYTRQEVH